MKTGGEENNEKRKLTQTIYEEEEGETLWRKKIM